MAGIAAIGIAVLLYASLSGRLRDSMVTPPMFFALFGLLIGGAGLQIAQFPLGHGAIHTLAEITLTLVLFADAARINLRLLVRDHDIPQRLLLFAMPLTIACGAAAALALPLGLGWAEAALLACILAPTDAALGQSVVSNSRVPVRIRQALNVESGLNDGIALPLVLLFAAIATGKTDADSAGTHAGFAAMQILLGPVAGIAVGWIAASIMDRAARNEWMSETFEGPAVLATAGLAYAAATLIGGNGFIAAFCAGLIFGFVIMDRCRFILEFAESEGQALTLLTFAIFGIAMVPELIGQITWPVVLYALASLTIVRMLPVFIALIGTGVSMRTTLFLGWFGPRGLASILFSLLIVERMDVPGVHTILIVTILTAMLSTFLHGVSAAPLARRYADWTDATGECEENRQVSEMPARIRLFR